MPERDGRPSARIWRETHDGPPVVAHVHPDAARVSCALCGVEGRAFVFGPHVYVDQCGHKQPPGATPTAPSTPPEEPPEVRRRRREREAAEGRALTTWRDAASAGLPELAYLHHVPNGGDRSPAVAGKLKAEGVLRGVPDYFLDVARGGYHGWRCELKAPEETRRELVDGVPRDVRVSRAGSLTPEQRVFAEHYRREGYAFVCAFGWEEARDHALRYLRGGLVRGAGQ